MLLAFPSDDVIWGATLSATNEDTAYPIENAQDNDPSNTFKSTTTSTVITITVASSTPVAYFLGNTNATSAALTNGAGMASQALTIPSRTADGKQRNGWKSLAGVGNRTSTTFTLTVSKTGSDVLEIGRICLVTEWQAPEVLIQNPPTFGRKRPGEVENVSRGGVTWRRAVPWAPIRRLVASTQDATTKDILDQLEAECRGLNRGFLLVPNEDINDAWFAQVSMDDFEFAQQFPDDVTDGLFPMRMTFVELSMGMPPALT